MNRQLLSEQAVAVAQHRYPKLAPNARLRVDMLSSTPLCFSLFGHLNAFREAAARVLDAALPWSIDAIESIELEHAPAAAARRMGGGKHDRTSFDAMLLVRSRDTPFLVGVETKYTEPFSEERYDKDSYRAISGRAASWFMHDMVDKAVGASTNQLWRNLMLAQEAEVDTGLPGAVVVIAPRTNKHASRGVEKMAGLLHEPGRRLAFVALEDVLGAAAEEPSLKAWAAAFWRRYLDTSWADVPT